MVKEALECNADIIMLDNMSIDEMKEAVLLDKAQQYVRFSGKILCKNVSSKNS